MKARRCFWTGTYVAAVEHEFGVDVDYAVLRKVYGGGNNDESRYSPAPCLGCEKKPFIGEPEICYASTSYVERQNLTMRVRMRRFTRLTNGFSKKLENSEHMVALHFIVYNFITRHATLRMPPALNAKVTDHLWDFEELVSMIDRAEATQKKKPISN